MSVLASPARPLQSIYDRRSSSRFELAIRPPASNETGATLAPASPQGPSKPHRRPTIQGFLPLPPISASPICTPTISTSSRTLSSPGDRGTSDCTEEYTTAPTTPSENNPRLLSPTWISTPPTPPPKLFRRSVTCIAQPSSPSNLSPSETFPPPLSGRRSSPPKRRASVPNLPVGHSGKWRAKVPETKDPLRTTFGVQSRSIFSHNVITHDEQSPELDLWTCEKQKDDLRKYHAFLELLSTEVSYLQDLRILNMVFLRNLPSLTSRTPVSSTFGRSSASVSFTHLPPYDALQPLTAIHPKPKEKAAARLLFSASEIDLLTRNTNEILDSHEHFVEELGIALEPLGFSVDIQTSETLAVSEDVQRRRIDNIDAAISIISTKFATEASRFSSYETFCAQHSQAIDVVRRIQYQHPIEWDAYENRCSSLISNLLNPDQPESETSPGPDVPAAKATLSAKDRKRTSSLSSLEGFRNRNRSKTKDLGADGKSEKSTRRLALLDYMIKPIQRICKYPLLLDQLATGKIITALSPSRTDVNVVVESAALAMRHVVSLVDEARHRQEVSLQSSLILSRMCATIRLKSTSGSNSSSIQVLTPSFLSSLGICLLAGSLDVMHNQASSPSSATAVAKYLGAFLYLGGYLVLVKVGKGKVYDPRHWFKLADFDVVDVGEQDAMLPFSFRLSCPGHDFEIAASCQREKTAWLSAIHESLLHPNSSVAWINEPVSSLQVDGKGDLIPSNLDGPFETIHALPTIQSIPEMANGDTADASESATDPMAPILRPPKTDTPSKVEQNGPSRRSSTTSVKAVFSTAVDPDTILIRRSTPSARSQVDLGLEDVISEPCITARSYATSHEEALFQAPHISRSAFGPKTSGGLGITKSRLINRHESVRVPRRRSNPSETSSKGRHISRTQSLKRRSSRQLTILPDRESIFFGLPSSFHSPLSNPSSTTNSAPCSRPESPVSDYFPSNRHQFLDEDRPSRPSSIYSNVKGLFGPSRPKQPVKAESKGSFLKRWVKHRLTSSAPGDLQAAVDNEFHAEVLAGLSPPQSPYLNQ
ncbi:hypothetical protein C8J56DRAFT_934097 [Mycena floridula]|nr:hypothetical protein C8J56DRAFT_934097 [Mycena floridula]